MRADNPDLIDVGPATPPPSWCLSGAEPSWDQLTAVSLRFGITLTRYSKLPPTAASWRSRHHSHQRRIVVVLHIIWLIILGLVVGLIARAVVPGRQPMGWIATAVLGIVGAYVGGTLGSVVFPPHQFDIHPPIKHSFLGALVGAVLLLVIYKVVTSRTRTL